ncbi:uncharacterized protein DS421_18g622010 [Arachis hypogaea]|nr:uncharacterized protein DS421_18g622010 [Arachis hypogaea]
MELVEVLEFKIMLVAVPIGHGFTHSFDDDVDEEGSDYGDLLILTESDMMRKVFQNEEAFTRDMVNVMGSVFVRVTQERMMTERSLVIRRRVFFFQQSMAEIVQTL